MTHPTRRRLLRYAAAATTAACFAPAAPRAAPAPGLQNALWIWETPSEHWREAAEFAAAHGFAVALLSIPPQDRARFIGDPAGLERALAPFAERGIAVQAAAGDPKWALKDEPPRGLEQILALVARSALLRGVHLDVEPHALPEWKNAEQATRDRLAAGTLATARLARRLLGPGKTLGSVLHPAFVNAVVESGEDLAAALSATADEVTLMAYRNRPDAAAAFADKLLARVDAAGKPWRFGLTARGGPEADKISYEPLGWRRMRADIEVLARTAAGRRSGPVYRGVAVNAYLPLKAISDR